MHRYDILLLVIIMKILIDELLNDQSRTRYWLANETGVTYLNISNLCNGKTNAIKFPVLESICKALGCNPGDILKLEDESV